MMKILVDADACPVKEIIEKAAVSVPFCIKPDALQNRRISKLLCILIQVIF